MINKFKVWDVVKTNDLHILYNSIWQQMFVEWQITEVIYLFEWFWYYIDNNTLNPFLEEELILVSSQKNNFYIDLMNSNEPI